MKRKTSPHKRRTYPGHIGNRHLSDTYHYVGEGSTQTKISLTSYNETVLETHETLTQELLIKKLSDKTCINWFQVCGLSDWKTISGIVKDCGMHNMDVKDILTPQHVIKIDESDGRMFAILNSCTYDDNMELHTEHISIIVSGHTVITFTENDNSIFKDVHQALKSNMLDIRKRGNGMLLTFLFNTVTANLAEAASKAEGLLEDIEEALLDITDNATTTGARIQQRRRDYLTIRRNSYPLKEQFQKLLRMESRIITKDLMPIYDDLYDQIQFVVQTCEGCREIISALVDLYISNNDLRMNAIMKRLTVVATLFIPLTFLVGLWGMNFTNMPELSWKYGYAFAWAIILAAGAATWLLLKRKDWY